MSSTAGEIIYKAFSPNLKILGCVVLGYIITKQGLFTAASAKGVSILSLNVSLPALIFSSIVTAFTPDNISAFGSLAVVAILYQVLGVVLAWLIREVFYVPRDFRWGILVMGCCSNWGNLPIAIVQTLGKSAPFNGQVDVDLGIAYDSVFVLIMNTCFFPLGLHKLCALDFKETKSVPPFKERWGGRIASWKQRINPRQTLRHDEEQPVELPEESGLDGPDGPEGAANDLSEKSQDDDVPGELKKRTVRYTSGSIGRKTSRQLSFTSMLENTRPIPPTAPLDATGQENTTHRTYHEPPTPAPSIHKASIWQKVHSLASGFLMPTTIALVVALPCALIQPLKALFTQVDGWTGGRIPNAPDDKPPLSFVLETAVFLGGITIPSALILLGASIARLEKPQKWRELPISSIVAMMVAKMIVLPVFGIFLVQGLRDHTSLYPREDKMRIFLSIICSGTPAAVNQLVVTQLYNPEGTAHTLAMNLALQYALMPVLSTAVAAIALYIVE